jgi:hypothetical protein
MEQNKPIFEKIDDLTKDLNSIFASLEDRISKVESQLRSVELDYMYGNIAETIYLETKRLINQKILDLTNVLLELKNSENTLH